MVFTKITQEFRLRATKVDSFVEQNIQPSFVDTAEWTQEMFYYFKERWEKKINSEKANVYEVKILETTSIPQTKSNKKRKKNRKCSF